MKLVVLQVERSMATTKTYQNYLRRWVSFFDLCRSTHPQKHMHIDLCVRLEIRIRFVDGVVGQVHHHFRPFGQAMRWMLSPGEGLF